MCPSGLIPALQELGQARQGGRNRETVRSALEISGFGWELGPTGFKMIPVLAGLM
jgi:hypothetical protein